jgi:hypothetical protein
MANNRKPLRDPNTIFGKEHKKTLKDLGYDKMDSFAQARFREKVIRDAMTSAFAKSKKEA